MRLLTLTAESLDVARGSGTAIAVIRLRDALARREVSAPALSVDRTALRRLERRARLLDYDAVLGVDGVGWEVARSHGLPFIAMIKAFFGGASSFERGVARHLLEARARRERRGAERADAVVVPSQFAADSLAHAYSIDPRRTHVIPEPFDMEQWRAAFPRRDRGGNRVLAVAHLYPRKRIVDLLHAWPLVVAARPDARLDVVGDGPELRRLARVAQHLPSCFLHGHVGHPDILEFYARSDCFALPSGQETFGYAVVEAMASGLPIVAANAGSLPEVCADAVCELIAAEDKEQLAAAVLRGLDPETRARAEVRNPARALAFSPSDVARRLIDVVAQTQAGRQRRAAGSD